jgi:glycosyltransferase involved in cell wall biosynthesis
MTRGLVSVIIPAFNAAEYIRETLHSALAQTYQSLEVIVVDDGSVDATCAIVEEFVEKDTRVRLVRQCNAGVGAARNTAIRLARGEYIAPLDADDIWFPEKLKKQVVRMEQSGEETGMVYCWSIRVNKDGEFLGAQFPSTAQGRLLDTAISGCIADNASVPLLRAVALAKVGLYLTRDEQGGAQGCEDWDLYIRIAESFSIRLVPEFLVAYVRTGSSMSVNGEAMVKSFSVVMQRARQRNPGLPAVTFRRAARNFYLYLAGWVHHRWSHIYMIKAVFNDPALLLKTTTFKDVIRLPLRGIVRSAGKQFGGRTRSSPKKRRSDSRLRSKERQRPSIIEAIFDRTEFGGQTP